MLKILLIFILPFSVLAQISSNNLDIVNDIDNKHSNHVSPFHEYVSLNDNKIYDVEIIVFAYKQQLPNYKTYTNKILFDDSKSLDLELKPEELNFIQDKQMPSSNQDVTIPSKTNSEYTVSINDEEEDKQVLSWFLHNSEFNTLNAIWQRLSKHDNIVPLIHQSWRQVETTFDNPTYVKLNNLQSDETDASVKARVNTGFDNDNYSINVKAQLEDGTDTNYRSDEEILENKLNAYADFSVSGMVALSQGRFMHFGHNLNLIRHYNDENNEKQSMVFSLVERKQLKTDELHYFDSPWFGSIVKITEYLGEEPIEL